MNAEKCGCGVNHEKECGLCSDRKELLFWCEVCGQAVAEKRCPGCGLKKTRKIKPSEM